MENEIYLLRTMQPYFVMSTSCFYQEIIAEHGISHFYAYNREDNEKNVIVVPDGCVDIIFAYDENGIHGKACGTVLGHSELFSEEKKSYFGVRFLPGVLPAVLDVKRDELINSQIDLHEIIKVKNLEQNVLESDDFETKKNIFMEAYLSCIQEEREQGNKQCLVSAIQQMIYQEDGDIKVKELEVKTGYSGRYIDKILKEKIGIGTKAFCKIVKFQKILNRLSMDTKTKLSELAMDFGYYDQAHFIRTFRENTSMTPKEYRNMVLKKEYRRRIIGN